MAKVVIIGAGLTGLSAAYHLEQNGICDYQIFEKQDRPGGLLRSFSQDGFTFDFTGHLLHISDDYFRNFINTITSLDSFLHIRRETGIHTHNTILEYPFQMNLFGLPPSTIYDCIEGFIKRKTSQRNPQNFYNWVMKYFGKGMGDNFFFPYNSKILSYSVKKVHPAWTGRWVPQTSLKEIIRGALEPVTNRTIGYNSFFYYPRTDGIEFIIKKLAKYLKTSIKTQHLVTAIDPLKKVVYFENGTTEPYETLISTLPLDDLLTITQWDARTTLKKAAEKLLCNTVLNFNLGFNVTDISPKHWLYFPEKKFLFYRLGFWNNICPASTPQNTSAIYGELSFLNATTSKKRIATLRSTAIKQALSFLGLTSNNIITEKCLILRHAYVIYDAWRQKNLRKILTTLNNSNIYSIGRFGEWKYSSMQEAVLDGKNVVATILQNQHKRTRTILPAHTTSLPMQSREMENTSQ